jgi:hypothetical protein
MSLPNCSPGYALDDVQWSLEDSHNVLGLSPGGSPHLSDLEAGNSSIAKLSHSFSLSSDLYSFYTSLGTRLDVDSDLASPSLHALPACKKESPSRRERQSRERSMSPYSVRFSSPLVERAPPRSRHRSPPAPTPVPRPLLPSSSSLAAVPRKPSRSSSNASAPGCIFPIVRRTPVDASKLPDAWLLYRSDQIRILQNHTNLKDKHPSELTRIIAQFWRAEKTNVKLWSVLFVPSCSLSFSSGYMLMLSVFYCDRYERAAQLLRQRHADEYPRPSLLSWLLLERLANGDPEHFSLVGNNLDEPLEHDVCTYCICAAVRLSFSLS